MVKSIFSVLLLVLACTAPLRAQDEPEDAAAKKPYSGIFGAGGGVDALWFFANTGALNDALAAKSMPNLNNRGMFLFGGHGYAYIMIVSNLRVGGMGAGGSMEATKIENGVFKRTRLAASFGGGTVEYVVPFGRFHIAFGGLIGGGSYTLTLTNAPNGDKSWDGVPNGESSYAVFTNSFFAWQPTLTAEFDVSPFMVFSVTGGYFGTSGKTWKLDDAFAIPDVPDFKLGGAFIRARLTFGLFIGE